MQINSGTRPIDDLIEQNLSELSISPPTGQFIARTVTPTAPVWSIAYEASASESPPPPSAASTDSKRQVEPSEAMAQSSATAAAADTPQPDHRLSVAPGSTKNRCRKGALEQGTTEYSLARSPFFYGGMPSEEAHERLRQEGKPYSYLLRTSSTKPDCPFALSMLFPSGEPCSFYIMLNGGLYEMKGYQQFPPEYRPGYASVLDMVRHAIEGKDHELAKRGDTYRCQPLVKLPADIHLKCMNRLKQCPWFHGAMSVTEAHGLLEGREPGTFLLRYSSEYTTAIKTPGHNPLELPKTPFSLSVQTAFKPISMKIRFADGLYFTDCKKFIHQSEASAVCVLTLINLLKAKAFITLLRWADKHHPITAVFLTRPLAKVMQEDSRITGNPKLEALDENVARD